MSEELVQELKTNILAQVEAKTINTKKRLNMTTLKGKIAGIKGPQRTALLTKLLAADESLTINTRSVCFLDIIGPSLQPVVVEKIKRPENNKNNY